MVFRGIGNVGRLRISGRGIFKGPGLHFRVRTIKSTKILNRMFTSRGIRKTEWSQINETPIKHAGLLARKIMRGMIRKDRSKSQRPAKPGRPPKSRAPGHPFKLIFSIPFRFDTAVVIGHQAFSTAQPLTVMETHEFGKRKRLRVAVKRTKRPMTMRARRAARRKFQEGKIQSVPQLYKDQIVRYPKRPFADPTLTRVTTRLPQLWKNSISRVRN